MDERDLITTLGETVAAPITALQLAFAHLVTRLAGAGQLDAFAFAQELEACAHVMPPGAFNQAAIAKNLYTLAQQIRDAKREDGPTSFQ